MTRINTNFLKEVLKINNYHEPSMIRDDGQRYDNNRYLEKSLKKSAKLQKRHSRKERVWAENGGGTKRSVNSSNRDKSRIKIARLHERIANQRLDHSLELFHKLSNPFFHLPKVCIIFFSTFV